MEVKEEPSSSMETDQVKDSTNDHSADESDGDDPIVERIPVYIANNLNAYLLQYPVRPATMTYDGNTVQKLAFRPQNQQLQLHMGLDTHNENYDESRGEQIALNVDGDKGSKTADSTFKSGLMDFQVLNGGKAVDDSRRYAAGLISNNRLHLTQVKGVLTMRPNLGYLDKSDKRAKAEGRSTDPDEPEIEPKIEAVTVKFSKGDAEKQRREKTYQSIKSKQEEEPWINLRFNQMGSAKWEDESQNLLCDDMDKKVNVDPVPQKYLQSMK